MEERRETEKITPLEQLENMEENDEDEFEQMSMDFFFFMFDFDLQKILLY